MSEKPTTETAEQKAAGMTQGHGDEKSAFPKEEQARQQRTSEKAAKESESRTVLKNAIKGQQEMHDNLTGHVIAGGGKMKVMEGNVTTDVTDPVSREYAMQRRAADSPKFARLMAESGRAPDQVGFFGKGDRLVGGGIYIDVERYEKVMADGDVIIEEDRVFANSRDLARALVQGDLPKF